MYRRAEVLKPLAIRPACAGGERGTEYLVSFGGDKDKVGEFYLGRASGFDPHTAVPRKLGVPGPAMQLALQALMSEVHHKIPNVILSGGLVGGPRSPTPEGGSARR